jgi:hypothetical protein
VASPTAECRIRNSEIPGISIAIRKVLFATKPFNDMNEMIQDNNQKVQYNDLCVTCMNKSSCMYIKNGAGPVYHCEEFENYPFRPEEVSSNPLNPAKKKTEEILVFYGLCKNCGNRMTCMNASPERIIWHCEEYV